MEISDTNQTTPATSPLLKKQPFLSGIRLKLFIAMVMSAALMLCVGYINYISAQQRFNSVDEISSTEISKLHTLQEVYSDIVIANVYGSKALDSNKVNQSEGQMFAGLFDEKIRDIDVFLSALMFGSESDEFLSRNGGETARIWNEHIREGDKNSIKVVKKVHNEVVPMIDEAQMHLDMYSRSFHKAFQTKEEVIVLLEKGDVAGANDMQTTVDTFEREALNEHIEPLSSALNGVEEVANEQVIEDIASLQHAVSQSKLITIFTLIVGVLLMFVIGFVFEYLYIAKPLATFAQTIENLSTGDMTERVPVNSNDEIGRLAMLFNRMMDRTTEIYTIMEEKIEEKTASLSLTLSKLESNNADLEKSQQATINLLEDIEHEKAAVEQKVKDRTSELERERGKLLQVTSNMRGGGILFDKERKVSFTNDAAGILLGLDKKASNEKIFDRFVSYFEKAGITTHLHSCFEGNSFTVNEIESGGKIYEIFFHALKHKGVVDSGNESDSVEGYFILFFDITDIKSLEHSKSELVAVASHQLRTPLTAVRGNVEMLIDESFGKLNKEQHELLEDIEVSTKRLIVMVNDMLDITKIEKGDLDLHIEELNIKQNIESILADLQVYAEKNNVTIDDGDVAEDVVIEGDKSRTRQIFQNLIDNGIKYGKHPGTLKISARLHNDVAEIIFKDDGIGIPKDEFSKMFDRFYRATNTANVPVSGSGLGLYIVKSIAHQLGGDIHFESEENVGTTFTVTLPRTQKKKQ